MIGRCGCSCAARWCPLHLVGGGHNDALTVALLVAGFALIAGSTTPARRWWPAVRCIGLSMSVKTTIGVVLPFAALLAAGGFRPASWRIAGANAVALCSPVRSARCSGCPFATGLGLGWIGALSNPGESVSWTSPPTAVGIAADAVGKWFGQHWNSVPVARAVALVRSLGVALLAIFWHCAQWQLQFYGAGLACLALIFMAPITQPWYLTWPLALFAATMVRDPVVRARSSCCRCSPSFRTVTARSSRCRCHWRS